MSVTTKWHDMASRKGWKVQISALNQRQLLKVELLAGRVGTRTRLSYEAVELLIEDGVISWEGLRNAKAQPVPHKPEQTWPLLEAHQIHRNSLLELAMAVYTFSCLSEDERKNC